MMLKAKATKPNTCSLFEDLSCLTTWHSSFSNILRYNGWSWRECTFAVFVVGTNWNFRENRPLWLHFVNILLSFANQQVSWQIFSRELFNLRFLLFFAKFFLSNLRANFRKSLSHLCSQNNTKNLPWQIISRELFN